MKISKTFILLIIISVSMFSFGNNDPQAIKIGTQIWASSNLDVASFKNGDIIPEAKTDEEWKEAGKEGKSVWCYYNNDPENAKYGKLYNWYAVNDSRGLAPKGWHIPNNNEWTLLSDYLGGKESAGQKMKSTSGWKIKKGKGNGTNESGFNGLPGGLRNSAGAFNSIESYGEWWSSIGDDTVWANFFMLWFNDESGHISGIREYKQFGLSVRCLKD
ncbi:MAG: fibrobacter succinogenes major paralogous domain-containing protein [Bacteroidia bacterium]